MTTQADIDIDYEQMDDLPLSEHFEWHLFQMDEIQTETENKNDTPIDDWQIA